MDIEIFLDCSEVGPQEVAMATQKFMAWYTDGAEIRCNKMPFASMTALTEPHHYLVDLGYADVVTSLRTLHARLRQYGVKVFFSFA